MDDPARLNCRPLGPDAAMTAAQVETQLPRLAGWSVVDGRLSKRFTFADFHRTMAFVDAVARIAHEQDHHPELVVSFGACTVAFTTHSAGGITLNDFICAARVDAGRETTPA